MKTNFSIYDLFRSNFDWDEINSGRNENRNLEIRLVFKYFPVASR